MKEFVKSERVKCFIMKPSSHRFPRFLKVKEFVKSEKVKCCYFETIVSQVSYCDFAVYHQLDLCRILEPKVANFVGDTFADLLYDKCLI